MAEKIATKVPRPPRACARVARARSLPAPPWPAPPGTSRCHVRTEALHGRPVLLLFSPARRLCPSRPHLLPLPHAHNHRHRNVRADATVYCGNLDDQVDEKMVWELFLQAGPVGQCPRTALLAALCPESRSCPCPCPCLPGSVHVYGPQSLLGVPVSVSCRVPFCAGARPCRCSARLCLFHEPSFGSSLTRAAPRPCALRPCWPP